MADQDLQRAARDGDYAQMVATLIRVGAFATLDVNQCNAIEEQIKARHISLAEATIADGTAQPPNAEEIAQFCNPETRIDAIKAYRQRSGLLLMYAYPLLRKRAGCDFGVANRTHSST